MIHKSIKYRLYPTLLQQIILAQIFGIQRFIYNHFLWARKWRYEDFKSGLITKEQARSSYYDDCKMLTSLKKEYDWLFESPNPGLQSTLKNLDAAYKRFFKTKQGYPKLKKKHHGKNSFTLTNQAFKIDKDKICCKSFFGSIPFIRHKPIIGRILNATISQKPSGKYYVSFTYECEAKHLPKSDKSIGLDLGIKDSIVTSDGIKFSNPKYLKQYELKLAFAQKQKSKKIFRSKNYDKAKIKAAKIYDKISSSRKSFLHQITSKLINENQVICIEDLNSKGMVQNHCLAKAIGDASFGEIVRQLEYKAQWYGRTVIKVNRFFPSSKLCSCCGFKNEFLTLSDREWVCLNCGTVHDRDINASNNTLEEGLRIHGESLIKAENACRLKPVELPSLDGAVKQEFHTVGDNCQQNG